MKKLIKWLLISIALIIVLVFANGCYYVFRGQERSMAKLEQGRELNLYECCSIYTMHLAVWILGKPGYPEASHLAYLMLKEPPECGYTIFDNAPVRIPKDSRKYKLTFPDNLKINSQEYVVTAGFYDLLGNYVGESPNIMTTYDCEFVATYADITYYVGKIKLYGALFKYIQDKSWIHSFTVRYCWSE